MAGKFRKKKSSKARRMHLVRIRSLSARASLARLQGRVDRAMRYKRTKDLAFASAERAGYGGAAQRAEESGEQLAMRAYKRRHPGTGE